MKILIYTIIFFQLFFSCKKKDTVLLIIPPNYINIEVEPLTTLYKKKVKKITSYTPNFPKLKDTTYLNQLGKITAKIEYGGITYYEYNTLGNLTHVLTTKGQNSNYFLSYERRKNTLIQKYHVLPHMNWEFDREKDKSEELDSNFYMFDNDGKLVRIVSPFGKNKQSVANYNYSTNAKLLSVKMYLVENNSDSTLKINSKLFYNKEDNVLYKIELFNYYVSGDTTFIEYFYNGDGLLDSMRRDDLVRIYNYEYY